MEEYEKGKMPEPDVTEIIKSFKPRFYAWECVSIKTNTRTLDFVIKDENLILRFLRGLNILVSILSRDADTKATSSLNRKPSNQSFKVMN